MIDIFDLEEKQQRMRERKRLSDKAYDRSPAGKARRRRQREKAKEYGKTYNKTHKLSYIFNRYDLTPEQYQALRSQQNDRCAICETPLIFEGRNRNSACIDHDHKTGAVRGFLCRLCNHGLGSFRDNPKFLDRAACYLFKPRIFSKPESSAGPDPPTKISA